MHIFITGGTRGIGNGMVKEFLKRGHKVSFTGTSDKSIQKALKELTGEFSGTICDIRNYENLVAAKDIAITKFGNIDVWINNAGVMQEDKVVSDISEEEISRVMDINVKGMILGTKIALVHMKETGKGFVYNFEGLGSDNRMYPKTVLYGSSKRLVRYFSHASDKELKDYKDISVGTISPGMVFTDLLLDGKTKESEKIFKILGNKVEEVTPFIVEEVIKGKKNISWLTTRKVMFKFIKSIFIK